MLRKQEKNWNGGDKLNEFLSLLFSPQEIAERVEENPFQYKWILILAAFSVALPAFITGHLIAGVSITLRYVLEFAVFSFFYFALLKVGRGQGGYAETLGAYIASLAPVVFMGLASLLRYAMVPIVQVFSQYPYLVADNISALLMATLSIWQAILLGKYSKYLHGLGKSVWIWVSVIFIFSITLHL